MYPYAFEEDFGNVLYFDTLLASRQYSHLRKFSHDHKYIVITMLGRREVRNIVHRDGLPWLAGSRQKSVQTLLLDGWFDDGAGSVGSDIFPNIWSEFGPIKVIL